MTRRERLEHKLSKRQEWAGKAESKSDVLYRSNDRYHGDTAFNTQPGHIPERARAIQRDERAYELSKLADHHEAKAAGLEHQLERTVFSDDTDAIAQLEARIAEREAKRDHMKRVNSLFRKEDTTSLAAMGLDLERLRVQVAAQYSWEKAPFVGWELTNLGALIRTDKKRLEEIKWRTAKAEKATQAGGCLVEASGPAGEYAAVTFPEKPERAILEALRTAGFHWSAPSWYGQTAKVPAEVLELTQGKDIQP
jgi:hypothetical protein